MRLFVAVEISDEARQIAADFAERLRGELGSTMPARWVDQGNLHLTVRFIGDVEDAKVAAVLEALRPPLPVAPFDIVLAGCGAFPRSGAPRILWIEVTEGLSSLAAMLDVFNQRLRPLGFAPDTRSFSAHLTLARIKSGTARLARRRVSAVPISPVRVGITKAVVFQSRLSPRGSRYERLLEVACEV